MKNKLRAKTILTIIAATAVSLPGRALAANSVIDNTADPYKEGNYQLNDILFLAIEFSKWLLGIVGSLTLVMFIYAGFTMLISAGNQTKVSQAKGILTASVIGLAVVFCSYIIIRFVLQALGISWEGTNVVTPAK